MAYGRLEVYYPDGKIETHLLTDDSVSVGRADGNVVALDSDSISRYHFSIIKQDDDITITDLESQNGTYVDGVLLPSNEPRILGDVEEIQVGSLRIIFRQIDDSPTMPMSPLDDETARYERDDADVRLELETTEIEVYPASSASSELSITNTSDEERRFSVRVSGLPGEWLRLTRPEIVLRAGETTNVLINVKPPRRPTTAPRLYTLKIEVAPAERPDLAIEAMLNVNVRPYRGFGIVVAPQLEPSDPISIFLQNQGSAPLTLRLNGRDRNNALKFYFPMGQQAPIQIEAGQQLRVDVQISAKNPPLTGASTVYPYKIEVRDSSAAQFLAVTEGKVRIAPRFRVWQVITGIGILLSVIAIAFLALIGMLLPATPTLENFAINGTQIAQGDDFVMTFDAENVDTFDVFVNGTLEQTVDGDVEEVRISTANRSGILRVELVGNNRGREVRRSEEANVYLPVDIASFTATPQRLVRNVVGSFSLSWNVPNAAFVQIQGLSEFTDNRLQSSTEYPAQHTLEGISGIPQNALEVTLYAQDERGTPLTQTLFINLIDPQCTALTETALHEGPDTRYPQVASVPEGAVIVVTAQDAQAGWLRVQLPGDIRGWGLRENFDCAENFNVGDLRTEVNVPPLPTLAPITPTSTIQPQPTATPN